MWSAQPSILTIVTIIYDDYFKANPGVKDLPGPGIEPQSPSPQALVIAISFNYNNLFFLEEMQNSKSHKLLKPPFKKS